MDKKANFNSERNFCMQNLNFKEIRFVTGDVNLKGEESSLHPSQNSVD